MKRSYPRRPSVNTNRPILVLEGAEDLRRQAVNWFRDHLNFRVIEPSGPKPELQTLQSDLMAALTVNLSQGVVINSGWLTPQLRELADGQEFPSSGMSGRIMERLLDRYGVGRLLLTGETKTEEPDFQALVGALAAQDECLPLLSTEPRGHRTHVAHLLFHTLATTTNWHVVDPSNLNAMWQALISHHVRRASLPGWVYEDSMAWYGSLDPSTVIVGDRFNPETAPYRWPFGKLNHCAVYLNQAINEAGIREDETAYVNVNDPGGENHLQRLLHRGSPKLIVLGKEATRTVTRLGLPHIELHHPQYVRRFHHGRLGKYADMLAEAYEGPGHSLTLHPFERPWTETNPITEEMS
jgi:hypothetical protein